MHANSYHLVWLLMLIVLTMGCGSSGGRYKEAPSDSLMASNSSESEASRTTSARANQLAGTTWVGTLSCDGGDAQESVIGFAPSGNPRYQIPSRDGVREAELSAPGQQIQYAPDGGGVAIVVVEALVVEPRHVAFTLNMSFERMRNGILDQERSVLTWDAVLSGDALEVEAQIRSQNTASRTDMMVQGDESIEACRGTFAKQTSSP